MSFSLEDEIGDDEIGEDIREYDGLEQDLREDLMQLSLLGTFADSPRAIARMRNRDLLTQSSVLAFESMGTEGLGTEGLVASVTEKMKKAAAKVAEITTRFASGVKSFLGKIFKPVIGLFDKLRGKTSEVAANKQDKVSGYNWKVAAVTVAIGAAVYVAKNNLSPASALEISHKINNSKWPFGMINATVEDKGGLSTGKLKISFGRPTDVQRQTGYASDLGYTGAIIEGLGNSMRRLYTEALEAFGGLGEKAFSLTRMGWKKFSEIFDRHIPNVVYKATNDPQAFHAAKFAGGGIKFGIILSLVWALWRYGRKLIVKTCQVIFSTIHSIWNKLFQKKQEEKK